MEWATENPHEIATSAIPQDVYKHVYKNPLFPLLGMVLDAFLEALVLSGL